MVLFVIEHGTVAGLEATAYFAAMMRFPMRLLLPSLALACLTACGEVGDDDTGPALADTAVGGNNEDDEDNEADTDDAQYGTQVGSEGVFGCQVESTTAIVNADAEVPGFAATANELLESHAGVWPGTLTVGVDESASLEISPGTDLSYVTVSGDDDCADYIIVSANAALSASSVTGMASGDLAIRPDRGRLLVSTAWAPTVTEIEPTAFDPDLMDDVYVELDATITPPTLSADLRLVGCVGGTCTPETIGTLTASR